MNEIVVRTRRVNFGWDYDSAKNPKVTAFQVALFADEALTKFGHMAQMGDAEARSTFINVNEGVVFVSARAIDGATGPFSNWCTPLKLNVQFVNLGVGANPDFVPERITSSEPDPDPETEPGPRKPDKVLNLRIIPE